MLNHALFLWRPHSGCWGWAQPLSALAAPLPALAPGPGVHEVAGPMAPPRPVPSCPPPSRRPQACQSPFVNTSLLCLLSLLTRPLACLGPLLAGPPPGHLTRLLEPRAGLRALAGPNTAAPKHTSNPDPGTMSGVGSAASRRLSPRLVGRRPLTGVPACPREPRCCPSPLSPRCSAGLPAPGVSHAGPWPLSGGQRWHPQTGPAGPSALRPQR